MIVILTGNRAKEFQDAPYDIEGIMKYKNKIAENVRKKLDLKDTDAVFVNING